MAQRIQTLFIDDLDGSEAARTVRFALEGTEYEIDLSTACRLSASPRPGPRSRQAA